jgi:hypothetical protein
MRIIRIKEMLDMAEEEWDRLTGEGEDREWTMAAGFRQSGVFKRDIDDMLAGKDWVGDAHE